ncbi:MAG: ABC transporter permease [Prevotellaceae bacterium]|nr:ABC transporter permease [Prevotellaceae bacterium]
MNLSFFIAKRIYSDKGDKRKVSRPAIHIATAGVAIGLAVMILTVSVVLGFKHTIRDKVIGFGSHIQVANFLTMQSSDPYPICIDDSIMRVIKGIEGVAHVERFALTQGILKTDEDFLGISFKGIGPEYDLSFIKSNLKSGSLPSFSDSANKGNLLLSSATADKMNLKTGDKVYAYFISDTGVKMRRFTVSGIFQTNMSQFDNSLCFTDLYTARKLNNWDGQLCSGAEVRVADLQLIDAVASRIADKVNRTTDHEGNIFSSQTIYESYPQIFSWLSLLDVNVWIILALMICVAGFTMISGLLIIILERTQMIGVLKALGMKGASVRHTFLWFAVFIIGKGMLIGDLLAAAIIVLQRQTGFISLDPTTYYVSEAPTEVNLPAFLLVNAATLLISVLVLVGPSFLISHIHPAKSMRYE